MGASPLVQPPPTHVSLPLGEGLTAKVEDIRELGRTTIKVGELWKCLQLYPQEEVALELGWGFQTGFRIPYVGPRLRPISPNLLSAVHHADEVQKKLSKEIEMGRISGPYKHIPISNMGIDTRGFRNVVSITHTGTRGRQISNQNTYTVCRDDIQFEIDRLLRASTAESTQETYDRGLTLFATFRYEFQLLSSWTPSLDQVVQL